MRISDWSSDVCSSDLVNVASRLEGQTKTYGVPVLVGEATAAAAGHDFALLEIDRIRVVGKQAPERIFALLGGPDMTSSDAFLARSEEHTSELQSLMRISYAVFCLKKKKKTNRRIKPTTTSSHSITQI